MLKNASSLAIVGLDTAENGPSKVRQVTNRIDAIIGARLLVLRCAAAIDAAGPKAARQQIAMIKVGIEAASNSEFDGIFVELS